MLCLSTWRLSVKFPLVAAAVLAFAFNAQAAESADAYPSKPVRIVVPYSAGGTTDYAARIVAQKLTEQNGQTFFVENKAGASGTIGTLDVVRSAADGYNILTNDTTYAMLPALFDKLAWDHKNDLVPVSMLIQSPVTLVVPQASKFQTMQDLIDFAKQNPGLLNFGSGGQGSSTHLSSEVFRDQAKINVAHIPYRGAGAAMTDLMAGQIDFLITATPTAIGPIKGNRVRALAVSGNERLKALPNVPTFKEAGLADYQVINWFGFAVPRNTPAPVVEKLSTLVLKALDDDKLRAQLEEQGAKPGTLKPAEFQKLVSDEITQWTDVAKKAGVKPE